MFDRVLNTPMFSSLENQLENRTLGISSTKSSEKEMWFACMLFQDLVINKNCRFLIGFAHFQFQLQSVDIKLLH